MASKIIDSSDPGIVVKETTIHLSDEKLRSLLSRTYECAQEDKGVFRLYKAYGVFLSIAGTLFLSLMTSTFNAIGNVSEETVTVIVWFLCIGCALMGFILMGVAVSDKMKNDTQLRDKAVDKMFEQNLSKE